MLEKYLPVMNPKWPVAERRTRVRRQLPPGEWPGAGPALPEEELLLFYALLLNGEMNAANLDLLFEFTSGEGDA